MLCFAVTLTGASWREDHLTNSSKALAGAVVMVLIGGVLGFALGRGTGDDNSERAVESVQISDESANRASLKRDEPLATETFLFSQSARSGALRGTNDQALTLTLSGVNGWVTRFTDRPAHDAQTVDVRDFLRRWDARFAGSPPNAVLSYLPAGSRTPRELVLELSRPRYDAEMETITYRARRILETTDELPGTRHPLEPINYPLPRSFGVASLFIDDVSDTDIGVTIIDKTLGVSVTGYRFLWRADLSQCAGYGSAPDSSNFQGGTWLTVYYTAFSSGSCFFKPTYARFDVYAAIDDDYENDDLTADTIQAGHFTKQGTITLSGIGQPVSSTGVVLCTDEDQGGDTVDLLGAGDGLC